MAVYENKRTLAYQNSRPQVRHRDISSTPCAVVAKAMKKYRPAPEKVSPEGQAITFYALNQIKSAMTAGLHNREVLSSDVYEVVSTYHDNIAEMAQRAAYYLLIVCIREARHTPNWEAMLTHLKSIGQEGLHSWFSSVKYGHGESSILQSFQNNAPDADLGSFVEALAWGYNNLKWSTGYGGPAWGAVADCLLKFINGTYTAEMMLDTNWTLAHNNGPIFNKGFFFRMYTNELKVLLDLQRGGQMLEGVLYYSGIKKYVDKNVMKLVKKHSGLAGEYVNWEVVVELGALGNYTNNIKHQIEKYGQTPESKAKAAEAKKKKIEEEEKAEAKKNKIHFEFMPGKSVPKAIVDREVV